MQPPQSKNNLKRFLSYTKPYSLLIVYAISLGIVRYLIPLVGPWTLKVLVDDFLAGQLPQTSKLSTLMLALFGLYLAYAVISYCRSFLSGLTGHKVIFDLRQGLYLHLQRMSLSFFDRQKIGAVVAHMTGDIAAAQNFVGSALINTAMDLSCIVAIIALLFVVHVKLALVSLAVFPFYIVTSFVLTKRIKFKSRAIHDQFQEISGELHEQFSAISTIQAYTQEELEALEFRKQNEIYLSDVITNVKLQSLALGVTAFLTSIGPLIVLWYGTQEVWRGAISIGNLMAFYAYLGMLYQPIQRLTELNLVLVNSLAAMDRIFNVFDTYPEVMESPNASVIKKSRGEIEFQGVTFSYDAKRVILSDLNLKIKAGEMVALVGASGAGKSTLVKLLPRFYDVTAGRILLDGVNIRDLTLKSLREQIAIVAQEPILLSGTVEENLRYGRQDATEEEIHHAAQLAFAGTFIQQLPEKYQTQIGERGVRLSGGQKQRLALARAFLKNAPIVILDEPTSALDSESEELIKQAMKRMLENRTALIIAHRLSTIQHASRVVVIQDGRVLEDGTAEELARSKSGLYRKFADYYYFSA